MKNIKQFVSRIFDAASVVSSVVAIASLVMFFCAVFIEAFAKQPCSDLSTCYALVIFLAGTIVALKIRLLDDGKRWVELILFILGGIFNVLFLLIAFLLDCWNKDADAMKVLNATIWMDFVIILKSLVLVVVLYFKKYFSLSKSDRKTDGIIKTDLFKHWLDKKDECNIIKRALTDKSYKQIDDGINDCDTNAELSRLGDSIIKFCLAKLELGKAPQTIAEKSKCESEKYLVEVVAKHYGLIDHIRKDKANKGTSDDYKFAGRKTKNNPHMYIAIAVKAMIAAIYSKTNDLGAITGLIDDWTKL